MMGRMLVMTCVGFATSGSASGSGAGFTLVAGAADFALGAAALGGAFAAGLAAFLAAGLAAAAAGFPATVRFDSPRRCTLPMTALRVTPPNSLAIWLADWPSPHSFFSTSTRSSLQDMTCSYLLGTTPQGAASRKFLEYPILITRV